MASSVRIVRGTGWVLIWSGALILGFVAYQLWGTGLLTSAEQAAGSTALDRRFEEERTEPLPDLVLPIADDGTVDESSLPSGTGVVIVEATPARGEAAAIISFPTLRSGGSRVPTGDVPVGDLTERVVSHVVWAGEDARTLRKGPGTYLDGPMPGQPGNAAIAGHRTTYGSPFNRLDELAPGHPIVVETAIGRHVYVVRDPRTVHGAREGMDVSANGGWMAVGPSATWVVADQQGAWLTLTTCHPMFSSRQRLVVVAELVSGPNHGLAIGAGAA